MEQPFPEKLNVAMIQVRRRRLLQLAGQSGEGFGSWRVRKELEQGALLSSLIWSAATVEIIERRFGRAAVWALVGALLSGLGLTHAYAYTIADTIPALVPGRATAWAVGYCLMAALFAVVQLRSRSDEGGRRPRSPPSP